MGMTPQAFFAAEMMGAVVFTKPLEELTGPLGNRLQPQGEIACLRREWASGHSILKRRNRVCE
jgi:hypothetical protein